MGKSGDKKSDSTEKPSSTGKSRKNSGRGPRSVARRASDSAISGTIPTPADASGSRRLSDSPTANPGGSAIAPASSSTDALPVPVVSPDIVADDVVRLQRMMVVVADSSHALTPVLQRQGTPTGPTSGSSAAGDAIASSSAQETSAVGAASTKSEAVSTATLKVSAPDGEKTPVSSRPAPNPPLRRVSDVEVASTSATGTRTVGVNVDMVALSTPRGPVTNFSQLLERIVALHNVGVMPSLVSLANHARASGGTLLDVRAVMRDWTKFFAEFGTNINARMGHMGDNLRSLEQRMATMVAMAKTANVDDINSQLRSIFGALENLNDDWNSRRSQQQSSSGRRSRNSVPASLDLASAPAGPSGEPTRRRKRAAPDGAQVAAKHDRPSELPTPIAP